MQLLKRDIISDVTGAALRMVNDSYLFQTDLWPVNGFVAGYGIKCQIEDRIYVGVNAYGYDQTPIIGRLGFNIFNTTEKRKNSQIDQLKLIFDCAYFNGFFFEDEFSKSPYYHNYQWFKFTYTPTNN
jgi:hypothetical protein